ncbi:MAG TPA: kelch repeat-containing protein, partial [Candidatus Deferrimicrobium sp.]|nr:kelch repeat-containing protein [Candidatus Deferrimicrobium sp.]
APAARLATVSESGPMLSARSGHSATLLDDGRVLIVGGLDSETLGATASIEVFDPGTLTFEAVGSLGMARWQPAATKLCDGRSS